MKKVAVAVVTFVALLALTAPVVLAADPPSPTGGPDATGCSGPNCR
jgi:hypothetical protein